MFDRVVGPMLRIRLLLVAALLIWLGWMFGRVEARPSRYTHAEIFAALRQVESGNREFPPDGDGGKAIGPYQIHRVYWQDSKVPGRYQDCRRRAYAERVIAAYMKRYAPRAWKSRNAEVIARTHNGGPRGRSKRATLPYWKKVEARLRAQRD